MHKLNGGGSEFPLEHRFLNIVLVFGFFLSVWSSISNYLLGLDFFLVEACIISSALLVGLYYLSVIKRQYSFSVSLLGILSCLVIPVSWVLNGGISGSIPYYVILFSSMAAIVFFGYRRIGIIIYYVIVSAGLIFLEYKYPSMITGYVSNTERYIDIFIGLITTIIANTAILMVILNHYHDEHEKAVSYLEKSRQAQENLMYLSYHDALTGLYNRTYFEKCLAEFEYKTIEEIGVFVIDIDGLKFVNDTFGHEQGDVILARAAKVLQISTREKDIVARIGGDEFTILVREVGQEDMEALYRRIRDTLQIENEKQSEAVIPLQVSIGYAYSTEHNQSIRELVREADDKMYREKLFHLSGTEGSMVQTMRKMIATRDHDTGVHGDRLQNLIATFAIAAGVPESETADIQLFAEFHDVGKIGIPDQILHKAGALTKEEREQIQRHCEIGFRIAQTSADLMPIADWILKHHEWWNGEGYPLGIKEEGIPLECRIVAIADAYDAMTSDRPYRKAVSHEAAIEELKNCAGTQFDPDLVKIFSGIQLKQK